MSDGLTERWCAKRGHPRVMCCVAIYRGSVCGTKVCHCEPCPTCGFGAGLRTE